MSGPARRKLIRSRLRGCGATESSAPGAPLYWGATIGDQLTGEQAPWDMGAVSSFEAMAGKGVSLVNFFAPFADCGGSKCSFYKFPTDPMESIRKHGSIPVFSWSSQSIPSSLNEPDFQLSDVIAGDYDSYIREFAEDARDWGHPFFLRFNWEMNGNWFPWSEGVNGNQAGEYVAAWRHVHDIFSSVGADQRDLGLVPQRRSRPQASEPRLLYPGDDYVDWTGLDGYNWGPSKGGWTSFAKLYDTTYHEITDTIAPSKPLLIGEMGSTENGGSKATWIGEALNEIPTAFPKVRACSGSTPTTTAWTGRSRPRAAPPAPSPRASSRRPTRATPTPTCPPALSPRPAEPPNRGLPGRLDVCPRLASPEEERTACDFGLQQRSPASLWSPARSSSWA